MQTKPGRSSKSEVTENSQAKKDDSTVEIQSDADSRSSDSEETKSSSSQDEEDDVEDKEDEEDKDEKEKEKEKDEDSSDSESDKKDANSKAASSPSSSDSKHSHHKKFKSEIAKKELVQTIADSYGPPSSKVICCARAFANSASNYAPSLLVDFSVDAYSFVRRLSLFPLRFKIEKYCSTQHIKVKKVSRVTASVLKELLVKRGHIQEKHTITHILLNPKLISSRIVSRRGVISVHISFILYNDSSVPYLI